MAQKRNGIIFSTSMFEFSGTCPYCWKSNVLAKKEQATDAHSNEVTQYVCHNCGRQVDYATKREGVCE